MDNPRPPRMTERSTSQTHFVIEEEVNDYCDAELGKEEKSGSVFEAWAPTILSVLSVICILLTIGIIIVVILYVKTIRSIDPCLSKECQETATLLLNSMDTSVDPCEDFHQFSCGQWIENAASISTLSTYDHTSIMRDRVLGRLRRLTESIEVNDIPALHQLKSLYDSCTDLESLEKVGLTPLFRLVHKMVPPHSNWSMARILGSIRRYTGQNYLVDLTISPDYTNTSYNSIYIDQPELPIDKVRDTTSDDVLTTYEALVESVAAILSHEAGPEYSVYQGIVDRVKVIVDWETQLSQGMIDGGSGSKPLLYNEMTVRDLNSLYEVEGHQVFGMDQNETVYTPVFNWTEYLSVVFEDVIAIKDDTRVIVKDLVYVQTLAKLLKRFPRQDFDLYITWQLVFTLGQWTRNDIRSLINSFTETLEERDDFTNRRTACISMLDTELPFLLTHKYVLKYVDQAVIDYTDEMVGHVITAFKNMVADLDWMDEGTKVKAIEKADRMRKFVGYPLWLRNSSAVEAFHTGLNNFSSTAYLQNMVTLMGWRSKRDLRSIREPVDVSWSSEADSPAEADAFYVDDMNAIGLPMGFLQRPFIGTGIRTADYGGLGVVIGHELMHGFDTEGRHNDADGRLSSWWSVETLAKFVDKTQCFVDQYNSYRIPELAGILGSNNTVNGRQTLAENIADNGGVREAWKAYRASVARGGAAEQRLPGLEGYSTEQVFFLAFAQSWCAYTTTAGLADTVLTNEHSPNRFRILGPLSNFPEFSTTWNCKAGSKMNPVHKCVLW